MEHGGVDDTGGALELDEGATEQGREADEVEQDEDVRNDFHTSHPTWLRHGVAKQFHDSSPRGFQTRYPAPHSALTRGDGPLRVDSGCPNPLLDPPMMQE
ncbi:hypothetical protein GCM10022275_15290 [Tessaracoccus defluvii]